MPLQQVQNNPQRVELHFAKAMTALLYCHRPQRHVQLFVVEPQAAECIAADGQTRREVEEDDDLIPRCSSNALLVTQMFSDGIGEHL
eukprot:1381720-Amphidinium_carterae.1